MNTHCPFRINNLREARRDGTTSAAFAPSMGTGSHARGFALVDLLFVCGIIGVLAIIAMPRLLLAKQSAGAAAAIGSLRAINSAELTFALTCGGGFYAPSLPDLGTPPPGSPEAFLSPGMTTGASVTRSGYVIRLEGTPFPHSPASCNGVAAGHAHQAE